LTLGIIVAGLLVTSHPSDRSSQLRCPADPAVLHQPHTRFSLYAGQDFVEVLTKCRVHYLLYGDSQLCWCAEILKQPGKQWSIHRAGIAKPRQLPKRWQWSLTLTLNSIHIGRALSARQTNGCGRAPPNFAPRWTTMQGALWKLREHSRQPPGAHARMVELAQI
jgi:hypothetical protein